MINEDAKITGRICWAVYEDGKKVKTGETKNLITNAGDLYYAERGVADLNAGTPVPTNFTDASGTFDGILELFNAGDAPAKGSNWSNGTTPIASSQKAMDSGYPKVNDDDGDNSGAGADVITYRVSYTTGQANGTADDLVITNPSPGATEAVLTHADGLGLTKTSAQTAKIWINHTITGA